MGEGKSPNIGFAACVCGRPTSSSRDKSRAATIRIAEAGQCPMLERAPASALLSLPPKTTRDVLPLFVWPTSQRVNGSDGKARSSSIASASRRNNWFSLMVVRSVFLINARRRPRSAQALSRSPSR